MSILRDQSFGDYADFATWHSSIALIAEIQTWDDSGANSLDSDLKTQMSRRSICNTAILRFWAPLAASPPTIVDDSALTFQQRQASDDSWSARYSCTTCSMWTVDSSWLLNLPLSYLLPSDDNVIKLISRHSFSISQVWLYSYVCIHLFFVMIVTRASLEARHHYINNFEVHPFELLIRK